MLHPCVFPGFTEEYIDEIKETLAGSNLYLLMLTALITAVQVRLCRATKYTVFPPHELPACLSEPSAAKTGLHSIRETFHMALSKFFPFFSAAHL